MALKDNGKTTVKGAPLAAYGGMVRPERGEVVRPARLQTELNVVEHNIGITPNATHHVEMRTSSVDRAKGFLLANVPLFGGLAMGMLLISIFFFRVPLFSLTALIIFWLTFVLAWLASYIYTLSISAEGIAWMEAHRKWKVIEREQAERWSYYKRTGGK